jgi:nucleoside-diphosphate-sugar epimerase
MDLLRASSLAGHQVLGIGLRACKGHGVVTAVDIRSASRLAAVFETFRPTHVIHLAGVSSPAKVPSGARS